MRVCVCTTSVNAAKYIFTSPMVSYYVLIIELYNCCYTDFLTYIQNVQPKDVSIRNMHVFHTFQLLFTYFKRFIFVDAVYLKSKVLFGLKHTRFLGEGLIEHD